MTEELLKEHAAEIESMTLIPSDGGRFEFSVDGELLFSKKELRRHAEPGEVLKIFSDFLAQQS